MSQVITLSNKRLLTSKRMSKGMMVNGDGWARVETSKASLPMRVSFLGDPACIFRRFDFLNMMVCGEEWCSTVARSFQM